LWSVMPVGWTSKTRAKIMLFNQDCPVGVDHCRKSHQYIVNAAPVDECDMEMDVCDDNAQCNDKVIGYECVCNVGWVGPGIGSYDGKTAGCTPGTTAAPTPPPNPCLGAKKYHKIINDRIISYALYRTVKILYEIALDNVGLCASQCAAKDNCGGFNYLVEQKQCHLFREDNDKLGNWNGYTNDNGATYKTMPAPIGSPALVYIIQPFCLCGEKYWKGDREKVCEAVYTTSTSTTSTSTTTTSTTSTTTDQQTTTSSSSAVWTTTSSTSAEAPSTTADPTTQAPTIAPPTTAQPTVGPTTAEPTTEPTVEPTTEQTAEPTTDPTVEPTTQPTAEPTTQPTAEPTEPTTPITDTTPTQSTEPAAPSQPPKPPVSSTWAPETQTITQPDTTTEDPRLRNCQPGYKLATNALGNFECLPNGGSIVVTECNHPTTGAVQITGKVSKAFDPRQPNGFITDPADNQWWMRVFVATDPVVTTWEEKNKIDPTHLYLNAIVRIGNGAGIVTGEQVFVDTGHNYKFICKYPLDDQTITDGYQVSGSDLEDSATGVGQLKYNVILAADTYKISETVSFTIEPLSPGLVYARAMKCSISNVVQNVQVAIFGQDNDKHADQYCVNPLISFAIGAGYGSMATQNFTYMAFKWSTDRSAAVNLEDQRLVCQIELSKTPFGSVTHPDCEL